MLAYRYDENTKEYLGTQEAQVNPKSGDYLLPANCTFTAPPSYTEGQIPVYNGNWEIVIDNRGKWQVKLSDITFSIVDYLGTKTGFQIITEEVYNAYQEDNDRYKVVDGVFTDVSDTEEYRQKKEQEERERIGNLECTKRVFVLMLEELGLDYFTQIKPLISSNRQAELEWELCVQLQRKNPLLDQLAQQFGVSSHQLDNLFKFANGEITIEQFRGEA